MTEIRRSSLLWCALAAAFSPVLANLTREFAFDTSAYTLLAALLLGLLLWRSPPSEGGGRPMLGGALVVLGLLAEVVGIASDSWSVARVGLAVGALGIALINGHPRMAVAALAFGLVPIPGFIYGIASPNLESLLGAAVASILTALGASLDVGGPLLQSGGRRFELLAKDSGLVTAVVCAEVGWYSAVRIGGDIGQAGLRAAGSAALGLILQPVLVMMCVGTLLLGRPEVGRFLLTHGLWLALAAGVLWYELHSWYIKKLRSAPGGCEVH